VFLTCSIRFGEKHPDLRLCQLIVNLTNQNDPFYVEDDIVERLLTEAMAKDAEDGKT
tara:strand:+ start:1097 stop:1267 length:171 start_codon:yes stop_codon:yes gene_type:complete